MLRNPLQHGVSWAWMCQNGPLSLIGPPCLLSPYRYCVSTTRAFSVPERREGVREEDAPRRAEGRGEQMSVLCGSCGPSALRNMPGFYYFSIFGCRGVFGCRRVCLLLCNSQLSRWRCSTRESVNTRSHITSEGRHSSYIQFFFGVILHLIHVGPG